MAGVLLMTLDILLDKEIETVDENLKLGKKKINIKKFIILVKFL